MPLVADNSPVSDLMRQIMEPVRLGMAGAQMAQANQMAQRDYVKQQMQQALANMRTEREFAFRQQQADVQHQESQQRFNLAERQFQHGAGMDERQMQRAEEQDTLAADWRKAEQGLRTNTEQRLREQFEFERDRMKAADAQQQQFRTAMLADFQGASLRIAQAGIDPTPFIQQFSHDPEGALKAVRQAEVKLQEEAEKQNHVMQQVEMLRGYAQGVPPQSRVRVDAILNAVANGMITPSNAFESIADEMDPGSITNFPIGNQRVTIPARIMGSGATWDERTPAQNREWMALARADMPAFQYAWVADDGSVAYFNEREAAMFESMDESLLTDPRMRDAKAAYQRHIESIAQRAKEMAIDIGGWAPSALTVSDTGQEPSQGRGFFGRARDTWDRHAAQWNQQPSSAQTESTPTPTQPRTYNATIGGQARTFTDADIERFARERNLTVEEVKAALGITE